MPPPPAVTPTSTLPLAPPLPRPSTAVVILALTLLLGTQPISTDLYLPTLPSLPAVFGVPIATAQLTLSVLVICFGAAQLVMGPVADRFGRRPVLLAGLALYTAASALAMPSPDIAWLVACRGAQGVGMAACVVCARAMLRDLYEPVAAAHVLARCSTWIGVLPHPRPHPRRLHRDDGGLARRVRGHRAVRRHRACTHRAALARDTGTTQSPGAAPASAAGELGRGGQPSRLLGLHGGVGLHLCGAVRFITGSAFVLVDVLGLSRREFGFGFAMVTSGFLLGSAWCRRLVPHLGLRRTVRVGAFVSIASAVSMAGLALAGVHHPMAIMGPQMLFTFAHGIHQPCAQMGAVGPFPAQAGAAAALSGFVCMVLAFVVGNWIGWSFDGTVYPLALTVAFWSIATAFAALVLVRRVAERT